LARWVPYQVLNILTQTGRSGRRPSQPEVLGNVRKAEVDSAAGDKNVLTNPWRL
jgi:hypothetical protein